MITATVAVRTELAGGLRELGRNASATSVVLASASVNQRRCVRTGAVSYPPLEHRPTGALHQAPTDVSVGSFS